MKKIKLTQNKVAIVDSDMFDYLNQFKWRYHNLGYAVTGRGIYMHKIINKTPNGFETDHINRNKLDNRKSNLRSATQGQNRINTNPQKNNTSGYTGIKFNKVRNTWVAYIYKDRKYIHLASSKNIAELISIRKQAERSYL